MRYLSRAACLCVLLTAGACSRPDDSKPVGAAAYPNPTTRMTPTEAPVINPETAIYLREAIEAYPLEDYPARAQESEIEGRVGLACRVAADDGLDRCVILAETPSGYDFARAAAVQMIRTRHADLSHNPAGSWVRLTVRFQMDKS